MQVKNSEPHTGVGNSVEHRINGKLDPEARQALIATKARNNPKERFDNLLHHLTPELIPECLAKIPRKSAAGVDGMTADQALGNLDWLLPPILEAIHKGTYQAPSVRRVYVPKLNSGKRPIGIPPIIDRSVQAAISKILNEIYELLIWISSKDWMSSRTSNNQRIDAQVEARLCTRSGYSRFLWKLKQGLVKKVPES